MSHISMQKTALDDATSVKGACEDMGLKIRENDRPVYYNGRRADVKCDYVISLPGTSYEVGLKFNPMTKTFDLYYDKYQGHVENVLGKNCAKLTQTAAYRKIIGKARLRGYQLGLTSKPKFNEKRQMLFEIDHY
jgi:hypothetical protein